MCTSIQLNYPKGSVVGRTMDIEAPVPYNILFQPRHYPTADNLLGGQYYSKYQLMGSAFHNLDPLKDGINEHGLIGITNDFGGFGLYSNKVYSDKINLSSYHFMTYVLGQFKNIDELLDALPSLHISTRNHRAEKVLSPKFHFMFTDSSQRSIVIEPHKKSLKVYDNPYQVMTNAPDFSKHLSNTERFFSAVDHLDDFNSAKYLPGAYDPKSRFIKAYYLRETALNSKNETEAMGQLYRILQVMALPKGFIKNDAYQSYTFTQYLTAYDTLTKTLTVQDCDNPQVYSLNFSDIQDTTKRQAFFIKSTFHSQKLSS